jgi:SAM-dependent methyltransferase
MMQPGMPNTETLERVTDEGRRRLYPSIRNPNWLVLTKRRELFQRWLSALPRRAATVLDVGGRIQPYRSLIPEKADHYIAVDPVATPLVDIVARGEQLPFLSDRFDLVLCTQVLDYSLDPAQVIAEIYRVLKPGGVLLLSVPSLCMRHADEMRWRFWPAGIRQLLSDFREFEIVPEGGSIAGFFRTVCAGLDLLARYSTVRTVVGFTVVPILNLTGLTLDNLVGSKNDVFTANYSVRAQK